MSTKSITEMLEELGPGPVSDDTSTDPAAPESREARGDREKTRL